MEHVGAKEFEQINWLPVEDRFKQCVCTTTFTFFNDISPEYMAEMFIHFDQNIIIRNSDLKLVNHIEKQKLDNKDYLTYALPYGINCHLSVKGIII